MVRLLASVPSVIYGLIGILVLVPFVGNDIITAHEKESVQNVVQLTGAGLRRDRRDPHDHDHPDHDRADLRGARLGAAVLARGGGGARPEPAARGARRDAAGDPPGDRRGRRARDRARARRGGDDPDGLRRQDVQRPSPSTGSSFFFEPLRTLASAIVDYHEGIGSPALGAAVYAFALLLLFSAFVLSVAGYLVKLPLRKYQTRG